MSSCSNFTEKARQHIQIRACDFLFEVSNDEADSKAVLATFSSVASVLAALSNALILLSIWKTLSLRKPSHILVTNLAISDFLVGIFVPLYWATDGIKQDNLSAYCQFNLVNRTIMYWLAAVSLYTLVVISIDRVLAVKLKVSYSLVVTAKRVKLVLLLCWIIAGTHAFILGFWEIISLKMVLRNVSVVTCLLVTVIAVSYTIALKELRKLASQVSAATTNHNSDSNVRAFDVLKYRMSLITMILVFLETILLYFPVFCLSTMKSFGNFPLNSLNFHFRIAEAVALLNSLINPVIYLWRMSDLRQAVHNTLRKVEIVNHRE